jgi:hypothetical protein
MNLKEALKAAIDGHKIARVGANPRYYVRFEEGVFVDQGGDSVRPRGDDWEIVSEPVKYSVDVWLENTPEKSTAGDIGMYVFGKYGEWRSNKHTKCKKYRVTVEEIAE